jgi:hypothetical protein
MRSSHLSTSPSRAIRSIGERNRSMATTSSIVRPTIKLSHIASTTCRSINSSSTLEQRSTPLLVHSSQLPRLIVPTRVSHVIWLGTGALSRQSWTRMRSRTPMPAGRYGRNTTEATEPSSRSWKFTQIISRFGQTQTRMRGVSSSMVVLGSC